MSALAVRASVQAPAPTPQAIGRAATLALYDELALSPKPGLVTLTDPGSHSDMDANTFMRSLFALRGYFVRIAQLGSQRAPFAALERCGIEAEERMLAATGGINTHRGAIFMLGLLCAAAGAASSGRRPLTLLHLQSALDSHWADDLRQRALRAPSLPGGLAARRHGLRSASDEAAAGFPVLFEVALPRLRASLRHGLSRSRAQLDTLASDLATALNTATWRQAAQRATPAWPKPGESAPSSCAGGCRPAARPTRSRRRAGSSAWACWRELRARLLGPGNAARRDAALAGR